MKNKQIIGLVVAGAVFIVTGVTSVLTNTLSANTMAEDVTTMLAGELEFDPPADDYIGVVNVVGTIQEQTQSSVLDTSSGYQHNTTMDYIDNLMDDSDNKGILLYVDKLIEYKETTGRPIWTYMAHYAASGGYMTSVTGDKIYANKNTVTGSIGVIMSGYDMSGLYEKLGIRYVSITSGVNKDSSKLTDEQVAIYQSQVDECYQEFVNIVADGRDMSADQVKALADGRTYTAKQAKANGLIDEIATYQDVMNQMASELGVDEFYTPSSEESILAAIFSKAEKLVPKSEAQILKETAEEKESGVLMYYAEQLQ